MITGVAYTEKARFCMTRKRFESFRLCLSEFCHKFKHYDNPRFFMANMGCKFGFILYGVGRNGMVCCFLN